MTAAAAELTALLQNFDQNAHRGTDLSLEPTLALLERLDRPQDKFPPIVHVAGTNGKGSTSAFTRSIAEAVGMRVHMSTSPHLVRINERVRLAGTLIDDDYLLDCCQRAAKATEGLVVSYFELTFAAAALAFSEVVADLLVLEVGLGGRLDATNIVEAPAVSVITPVSFDHQAILGKTLGQIAWKKAGIIKQNCPVVSAAQESDAAGVIAEEAFAKSAPLYFLSQDDIAQVPDNIGLIGAHQRANAALAIKAMSVFQGHPINADIIESGTQNVYWPARMQRLKNGPLTEQLNGKAVWVDGGHNPHAARALADILRTFDGETTLILAMLDNKDAAGFLAEFSDLNVNIIACPNISTKSVFPPGDLKQIAERAGLKAMQKDSFEDALSEAAASKADRILICGSLYLAGGALCMNDEAPV
ncbi:MAG: folylpolyglutamate synthase/dihydrofolate synthase family protein [Pseudomonadota bacterium]